MHVDNLVAALASARTCVCGHACVTLMLLARRGTRALAKSSANLCKENAGGTFSPCSAARTTIHIALQTEKQSPTPREGRTRSALIALIVVAGVAAR